MKIKRFFFIIFIFLIVISGIEISAFFLTDKKNLISITPYKEIFQRSWYEPHPHLIYNLKKNFTFEMRSNENNHVTVTTNQFGFRSTHEYDLNSVTKSPSTFRIATFGGSTTMGVNGDKTIWPYLMGKYLKKLNPNLEIEVLNEGVMGYTSLDNLIDLSIRVIDFDCDAYILYLGINDYLAAAPKNKYTTDHSHFRATLYENLIFSPLELLPRWLLDSRAVRWALTRMSAQRESLIDLTTRKKQLAVTNSSSQFRKQNESKVRNELDPRLVTRNIIRNIKSFIGIVQSHNPKSQIFLSSFYSKSNPPHIQELNRNLKKLSQDSSIFFINLVEALSATKNPTYDDCHFTIEGDRVTAKTFAQSVKSKMIDSAGKADGLILRKKNAY